ncbi:PucR family transcriptional regulator [Streptomyces chartreusis]|uniref:PucR family transcriptional regulator n=1 Tax=Streptomyces chartreusis TaxID=1969 RepID=UPI003426A2BA
MIGYGSQEGTRLAALCVERLRADNATYRSLDPSTLLPAIVTLDDIVIGALSANRDFSASELAEIETHGRQRAGMGVPIDDLLQGWRVCAQTFVEEIARYGHAQAVAEPVLLQLVMDLHTTCNAAMVVSAQGHREAELENVGSEYERRSEFVRGVLHSTLGIGDIRLRAQMYGFELGRRFHAIRARVCSSGESVTELEGRLGLAGGGRSGLVSVIDGDLAGFVDTPPDRLDDGYVGLGPAVPFDDLAHSFRRATRALTTAVAFGMPGIHDMASLGVLPAVMSDQEVGEELALRYLAPLAALSDDAADNLLTTVKYYLAHGQRIEPAARELLIHPNTLRYRIRRYQELTGCDLREAGTALEVWWAVQVTRIDGHGPSRTRS